MWDLRRKDIILLKLDSFLLICSEIEIIYDKAESMQMLAKEIFQLVIIITVI